MKIIEAQTCKERFVCMEQIKHDTSIYRKRFLFKQMRQYTGL